MESTSKILDAFHAMNVVIQKDMYASEGEEEILRYTVNERAELCSRISHLFGGTFPHFLAVHPLITTSTREFNEA